MRGRAPRRRGARAPQAAHGRARAHGRQRVCGAASWLPPSRSRSLSRTSATPSCGARRLPGRRLRGSSRASRSSRRRSRRRSSWCSSRCSAGPREPRPAARGPRACSPIVPETLRARAGAATAGSPRSADSVVTASGARARARVFAPGPPLARPPRRLPARLRAAAVAGRPGCGAGPGRACCTRKPVGELRQRTASDRPASR